MWWTILCLILHFHCQLGTSDDTRDVAKTFHIISTIRGQWNSWILRKEYVDHFLSHLTTPLNSFFSSFVRIDFNHNGYLGWSQLLWFDWHRSCWHQRCWLCNKILRCSSSWYNCPTIKCEWCPDAWQVITVAQSREETWDHLFQTFLDYLTVKMLLVMITICGYVHSVVKKEYALWLCWVSRNDCTVYAYGIITNHLMILIEAYVLRIEKFGEFCFPRFWIGQTSSCTIER